MPAGHDVQPTLPGRHSRHRRRHRRLAVAGGPEDFDALLPAANLGGGTLKGAHERHQVLLLLCGQLVAQDQVEEFDGIIQRQQPLIMQVGRIVLDPAQREG
jgi:hypothetical protein